MHLTPEQEQIGNDNFYEALAGSRERFKTEATRREFLAGVTAGTVGLGAAYFGYSKLKGNPVKVGFIGTGDEGNILITEHPAEGGYMEIVAIADARPSNRERVFKGDGNEHRVGLNKKLGRDATKDIQVYDNADELLARDDIEAVVIAVPLNMHAPLAIKALQAGKHVLCEKLMAKTVGDCKEMIAAARKANRLLAVGHQRHYSVLYDNANYLVQQGLLGDIKYIRAQWHRNSSFPGRDAWRQPKLHPKTGKLLWPQEDMVLDGKTEQYGYEDLEHLINWRLFDDTGGGLMGELGSHQMDAASIFLGKVHPIAVAGYGGTNFYGIEGVGPQDKWGDDREIFDQIFTTFEFPGKQYENDSDDRCVVTYSSISTNRFEPYGELVYGSRGTLIMKAEKEALLYKEAGPTGGGGPDQRLWVVNAGEAGGPALDSYETTSPAAVAAASTMPEKISRGYREEMEHLCYLIREMDGDYYPGGKPQPPSEGGLRCNGEIAMADAVMAHTANMAMRYGIRIPFDNGWFDWESPALPENDVPKLAAKVREATGGKIGEPNRKAAPSVPDDKKVA
ncbi:Gfo/Idh/MocA family protein [Alienimonas chondri]|uniref:Inositol 2-dehydrogenase/D-chiro-inositol 3-dehydrogenase n=1 Tax=Alienimonas chondri TaxID=2681879 RepID=A0ABX1VHM1_9PLAN|nr:Gfo/Idh/MocA family oxidoreductase [Alienimonas chondri]NNJ27612.1 Inositol 2-dehydrogenase/D-chiro-inositol 3-dehydrogenase [Alienimonas chondri]